MRPFGLYNSPNLHWVQKIIWCFPVNLGNRLLSETSSHIFRIAHLNGGNKYIYEYICLYWAQRWPRRPIQTCIDGLYAPSEYFQLRSQQNRGRGGHYDRVLENCKRSWIQFDVVLGCFYWSQEAILNLHVLVKHWPDAIFLYFRRVC